RVVPPAVIHQHTHRFVSDHQFLSPEPPNDFAYWVTDILGERRLGEELAAVDVVRFRTLEGLRDKMIAVLERHLSGGRPMRSAAEGSEFHFMKAVNFILPTPHLAHDLKEFLHGLRKVSIHSLYYHMFEARLRLEREQNDFSAWFSHSLHDPDLGKAVSKLDPYTQTMEGLRRRVARLVEQRLTGATA
ncbi:MAG: DUF5752 family protein, partial [Nitrospiria bacterium]